MMLLETNLKKMFKNVQVGLLAVILGFSGNAFADDAAEAEAALKEARVYFSEREESVKVNMAVISAQRAIKLATDDDVKYAAWILISRAQYWRGTHVTTDDEKMKWHEEGMTAAKQAYQLNDDYADGYYFYAVNLGRWGLAKGFPSNLVRKDELIKHTKEAMERMTLDGADGEMIDGYGPHRTLGRMYFKLPGFAGGSRPNALTHLEKAVSEAPQLVLNTVYLAEVLADGSGTEKARARKLLDEILARDPASFDLDRIPETKEELLEAKKLRDSI